MGSTPMDGNLDEERYVMMDYYSPAAIADESGEVTERYVFSAFGIRQILTSGYEPRSDSECLWEFAFQGQFEDAETGWLDYGFRYYIPYLGRWPSKDPIEEEGSLNLYAMVENQPINKYDHFGLAPQLLGTTGDVVTDDPLTNEKGALGKLYLPPEEECGDMEGFYRHCVNTCLLKKETAGWLSNKTADLITGDSGKTDTNSANDREGAYAGDWAATQPSCEEACKRPWKNKNKRTCCQISGKRHLPANSPHCKCTPKKPTK